MNAAAPFPQPTAGEVVLCRFPQDLIRPQPGPKARPGVILKVFAPLPGEGGHRVMACYGTSNLARLYPYEFEITKQRHAQEFASAGLSFDTKFNLRQVVTLPYTGEWFEVPARPMFGPTPKLGVLHPLTVSRLIVAAKAAGR
jgi:hypothetical protein